MIMALTLRTVPLTLLLPAALNIFVIILSNKATAQTASCTAALVGLSPCTKYVPGNSSTPSTTCCSQLSSVVRSQPQCLCPLLKGGASNFGVAINQTLALALPRACKVQTPPVSQCDAVNGPANSNSGPSPVEPPADSPSDEIPDDDPNDPSDVPSGMGSKTGPRTDDGSSSVGGSSSVDASFFGIFVLIASSSWAFSGTMFML